MKINKYWRFLLSFVLVIFAISITSPLVVSQNETNGVVNKTSLEMLKNDGKAIKNKDVVFSNQPTAKIICEKIEEAANSEKISRAKNIDKDLISLNIIRGTQVALGLYCAFGFFFMVYHVFLNRQYDIDKKTNWMLELLIREFRTMVLLPISVGFAICIVSIFEQVSGDIEFKMLGFEFKGASGPIIFWILCFLALVIGLKQLWVGESKS